MKCPMTFGGDPRSASTDECREGCAWLVKNGRLECCAVALMACEAMAEGRAWMPKNKTVEEEVCR